MPLRQSDRPGEKAKTSRRKEPNKRRRREKSEQEKEDSLIGHKLRRTPEL